MPLLSNYLNSTPMAGWITILTMAMLISLTACDVYDSQEEPGEITEEDLPDDLPTPSSSLEEKDIFEVVEDEPKPIGGMESIYENLTYPETAREVGIQGVVVVRFVVDSEGNVREPQVIREIGGGAGEAAKEAITSTEWQPGEQRERNVAVRMTVPVRFQLQNSDSEQSTDEIESDKAEFPEAKMDEIVVTGYSS